MSRAARTDAAAPSSDHACGCGLSPSMKPSISRPSHRTRARRRAARPRSPRARRDAGAPERSGSTADPRGGPHRRDDGQRSSRRCACRGPCEEVVTGRGVVKRWCSAVRITLASGLQRLCQLTGQSRVEGPRRPASPGGTQRSHPGARDARLRGRPAAGLGGAPRPGCAGRGRHPLHGGQRAAAPPGPGADRGVPGGRCRGRGWIRARARAVARRGRPGRRPAHRARCRDDPVRRQHGARSGG